MASRSLNRVMLIGNLTRDPELRYTPQGTAVCTLGLATNRSWQPSDGGERQEATEFHRLVAWQKLAELCAQLLFKGRKVFVGGRLQTRTWTGRDEQERTTTEIVIDNMIILDSKRREGQEGTRAFQGNVVSRPSVASSKQAGDQKAVKDGKKESTKKSSPAKTSADTKVMVDKAEVKEEVKADDIPF